MHRKWGKTSNVDQPKHAFERQGYLVRTPEMPWSGRRFYDAPYPEALRQIGEAMQQLRDQSAKRVVVGGHSFGANAALAFAAEHPDIDGILMLAPGHTPESRGMQENGVAASLQKAKDLVAAGQAEDEAYFTDVNQGKRQTIRTTASIYLGYFDPAGRGPMPVSASALRRPIPLRLIGTEDRLFHLLADEKYVFKRVPDHPLSQYVVVHADHMTTPTAGTSEILAWLKTLEE